jgi:hypothetical protein
LVFPSPTTALLRLGDANDTKAAVTQLKSSGELYARSETLQRRPQSAPIRSF